MTFRHDCKKGGCYIEKQTPDWKFLDNAFSGNIKVSDIDGIVEASGRLLIMEWKGEGVPVTKGQDIMFKEASKRNDIVFFLINGCPEKTKASHLKIYWNGQICFDKPCTNEDLFSKCQSWETYARSRP